MVISNIHEFRGRGDLRYTIPLYNFFVKGYPHLHKICIKFFCIFCAKKMAFFEKNFVTSYDFWNIFGPWQPLKIALLSPYPPPWFSQSSRTFQMPLKQCFVYLLNNRYWQKDINPKRLSYQMRTDVMVMRRLAAQRAMTKSPVKVCSLRACSIIRQGSSKAVPVPMVKNHG